MTIREARHYAGATGRDLHIDTPLTSLTIGYRPVGLIADQILPPVPVGKQHDGYYIWPRHEWLRIRNAERAPGTRANRINSTVSSDNYFAKNYALGVDIPFEDLGNADDPLDYRNSNANLVRDNLALNWEDRLAVTLVDTTNVGSATNLSNNYADIANSSPIQDIDVGLESIRSTTGMEANLMIVSMASWRRLRRHQDIIDYVRGKGDNVGGGGVSEQQLAGAFGFNRVLIGRGVKNTADEGVSAANATYSDIWSTSIILLHVAASPGRMVPSYGYTFQWTPPGMPGPFAVERYDLRPEKVEAVEVHHWQDEKVTATELGYLITNA